MRRNKRNRAVYFIAIIFVILIGLASRHYQDILPGWIGDYAGDALWALMVFLGIGFVFIRWPTSKVAFSSFVFSFGIEISQLYHSPWIDAIRRTRMGALILGFGFLWSDLLSYAIGIALGMMVEKLVFRKIST